MYSYCCKVKNPLLFVDMRLGKSIVTIRYIKTLLDYGMIFITCPYSGLYQWKEELEKENEFDVIMAIGGKDARLSIAQRLLSRPEDHIKWVLTNPEFHRTCTILMAKDFDVWVADEATYLQNATSKTAQFYFKKSTHIPIKLGLTGTPASEGEHQYFMLCKTIEPQVFKEESYYQFLNGNFGKLPNHKYLTNAKGTAYIRRQLAKYVLFMNRKDLGIGGRIERIKRISSLDKIKKVYMKAEKEFILDIQDKDIYKETIWATTKWLWLRKLCAGIIDEVVIDDTKLKDLHDLITTELQNEQIILWAVYHEEIKALMKLFPHALEIHGKVAPLLREQRRQAFQKGESNIVIANPYALRFGADLSAATTVIYFSLPVSGLTYAQSEARPFNVRLLNDVLFIYMLRENSVEIDIYKSVQKKEDRRSTIRRIVNSMQERL